VIPAIPAASGTAVIPAVPASSDELQVADSVGNTWDRVGAALEQSQIGKISERDPGWKTYTVMVAPQKDAAPAPAAPAPPEEHHWYSRILHPFGGKSDRNASSATPGAASEVKIKVKADVNGSRIIVNAGSSDAQAAAAAQRVVGTLRDLLTQQASGK
jgi:uncharacterized lipoprotein